MDLQLKGKTALVTGSTAGIGLAIAERLAAEGVEVTITGRNQAKLDEAAAQIAKVGKVNPVLADPATAEGAATLIAAVPQTDILVNNLGIYEAKAFTDITDADWHHFFEVNVVSGARLARHYFPRMLEKNWGRVIFISSESSLMIPAEMIHYGMTKTAQLAISRGLAKRVAGTGVTVNAVLPGPALSEGVAEMLKKEVTATGRSLEEVATAFVTSHRPSSIIRRPISVVEVANMVVYAASPQASATTGAALRVDGGIVDTIA